MQTQQKVESQWMSRAVAKCEKCGGGMVQWDFIQDEEQGLEIISCECKIGHTGSIVSDLDGSEGVEFRGNVAGYI